MRKLLLLSSLILVVTSTIVLQSCKVKKKKAQESAKKEEMTKPTNELSQNKEIISEENIIIHQPGTINPSQLDSIKGVLNKEKRKIK